MRRDVFCAADICVTSNEIAIDKHTYMKGLTLFKDVFLNIFLNHCAKHFLGRFAKQMNPCSYRPLPGLMVAPTHNTEEVLYVAGCIEI